MKIKTIKYENNIDILRGISILLVVIYHLKIQIHETTLLSGGYLGVDIFFVISGYLITSILFLNTKGNKFNWKLFPKNKIKFLKKHDYIGKRCMIFKDNIKNFPEVKFEILNH